MTRPSDDVPYSLSTLDPEDQALLAALKPEGPEPGTPAFNAEAEAALEAQAAAAAAEGQPAPGDAPAPAPNEPPAAPSPAPTAAPAAPTDAPAPADAPAATPAPAPAGQSEGDVRAALRAARRNEKRLAEELRAREARIAELEQSVGSTQGANAGGEARTLADMTAEEVADMRENFPQQYAMLQELQNLRQRVERAEAIAAPAPAPAAWEPPAYPPEVQEVIDQVPTLLSWQVNETAQERFNTAVVFDTALRADPAWKAKSPVERFQEAVRLTELRMGNAPSAAPQAAAAAPVANRTDPAAAIAAIKPVTPAGISDFRGGGPASPPAFGRDQYAQMSDEQILGALRPEP